MCVRVPLSLSPSLSLPLSVTLAETYPAVRLVGLCGCAAAADAVGGVDRRQSRGRRRKDIARQRRGVRLVVVAAPLSQVRSDGRRRRGGRGGHCAVERQRRRERGEEGEGERSKVTTDREERDEEAEGK